MSDRHISYTNGRQITLLHNTQVIYYFCFCSLLEKVVQKLEIKI